ncbi:hypothetical protein BDK51DRAFT_47157 [Blyttiomyces helicus]|uniref:Uncharacterized protein n=1 Tax=Blyttiomyces helicus TaxID=388810 RepID=A0A4P9W254_9FUNG|nr:hypothetical protein BDK51DRAFT_47157 [Blyttiomyces helicus]|eukprot:RKO86204.1 hypothetical protein BDK51DRAFT_47157 [Blyttiomyces helicus]
MNLVNVQPPKRPAPGPLSSSSTQTGTSTTSFPATSLVDEASDNFKLATILANFDWTPVLRLVQRVRPFATMSSGMVELARFVLLKAAAPGFRGHILAAPPQMQALWHALREFTHEYFELSSTLVGKPTVLGYDPPGEELGARDKLGPESPLWSSGIGQNDGIMKGDAGRGFRDSEDDGVKEERLRARAIADSWPYFVLAERLATFDGQPLLKLLRFSTHPNAEMNNEIRELARFLLLKAVKRDLDGTALSPPAQIDELWHLLLRFPAQYQELCASLLGHRVGVYGDGGVSIGHDPLQAYGDPRQRNDRLAATFAAHVPAFGEPPFSPLWDKSASITNS